MKNIFIFILLFCVVVLSADIHGKLEIGNVVENDKLQLSNIAYTEIEIEYLIDWIIDLSFYGGWLTWWEHLDGKIVKAPFQDIYTIGIEIIKDNFYIGIEHFCSHPVISSSKYIDINRRDGMTAIKAGITW